MWRKILLPLALNLFVFAILALSSQHSIKLVQSAPAAPADNTFAVLTTTDAIDNNIGDNICLATNGMCTLRAAIQEVNAQYAAHGGFYTITVPGAFTFFSPPRLYSLTLVGSGEDNAATGDLDIKSNLVILTKFGYPARVSASGLGDRVFDVIQPTTRTITVTINNLWLESGTGTNYGGGLAVENGSHVTLNSVRVLTNTVTGQNADGGGIDQRGGTLTLNNVLVRANHVQGGNNGSALGGGIYLSGKLIVNASTVLNNRITSSAPTDNLSGYGGGMHIGCCVGFLDIKDSTVSGNSILLGSAAQFLIGGGINGGGVVTITRSIISGNSLTATGSNATVIEGGGLYIANGRLNILTSMVTNNSISAANPSLGMYGGGLAFLSHAQIISSTIAFNSVRVGSDPAGYGGGISVGGSDYGADLLLDRSIVQSNVANDGGGINLVITTSMAVRNSLLEGNTATNGAGIFNVGVLSVTNATFYFNVATKSGGGIYDSSIANIDSATFNNDKADFDGDNTGDGGGIFVGNGATLYLRNSLLTGNEDDSATTILPDCAGTIISQDYNLIEHNPSGCLIIGATGHNLYGTFPGVLDSGAQNNGGDTPTIALPPNSAAINAGDPTGCKDENGNPLPIDQRGYPRIGPCDIGAYEFALHTYLPLVLKNF